MLPEDGSDELEEGDNIERAGLRSWWFAVEEHVEELEAYRVSLDVQSE